MKTAGRSGVYWDDVDDKTGHLKPATAKKAGIVKIGDGINVTLDGTISVDEVEINPATTETAGIVKIGDGINVTADGTISVSSGGVETEYGTFIVSRSYGGGTQYDMHLLFEKGMTWADFVTSKYNPFVGGVGGSPIKIIGDEVYAYDLQGMDDYVPMVMKSYYINYFSELQQQVKATDLISTMNYYFN